MCIRGFGLLISGEVESAAELALEKCPGHERELELPAGDMTQKKPEMENKARAESAAVDLDDRATGSHDAYEDVPVAASFLQASL